MGGEVTVLAGEETRGIWGGRQWIWWQVQMVDLIFSKSPCPLSSNICHQDGLWAYKEVRKRVLNLLPVYHQGASLLTACLFGMSARYSVVVDRIWLLRSFKSSYDSATHAIERLYTKCL